MSYEPPLKITIPLPREIEKGFGINSTGRYGGNLRVRCTNREYDLIKHEADKLDISLAMFGRWCAVFVASRLLEHRKANSTDMSVGDEDEFDTTDIRASLRR